MTERDTYYLTTAIFYPSARPALHSMFEAIGADTIARYHRLLGKDVRFLTGLDEHSANVERDANAEGIDPHALIDPWAETWRATFERYAISFDRFIRTTDPDHAMAATEMVRRAQANGDVYQGLYSGWFCTGCNEFKTDQQLVDGRCPDHPTLEPQWLEEHNYFFRLSAYQERLERLYADNPSFCEPEHFRNEVLGWLRDGLRDFSLSRSVTWGIPFPGDPEHRIYVWFDALTNYLTGAGFPGDQAELDRWWPADLHVIGKNITRFHCLYWPAMLMSAGLPLPKQVFAHGFMYDVGGQRMSKTTGNTEDPDEMADRFGVDGVRYAVLREVPFDRDANVTLDGFVRRYNADLANDLGNLVNRTVSMSRRYLEGRLPAVTDASRDADAGLRATAEAAVADYHAAMARHHLDEALAAMMTLAQAANGYAEGQAPWSLVKSGDEQRAGQVLAVMAEACRIVGHLLAAVAPSGARNLLEQLGAPPPYDERGAGGPGLVTLLAWGAGPAEWVTGTATPIFPRVEVEVAP